MKKRVTVFWLTPAGRERKSFVRIIGRLAADFEAPAFEPHLTLGYIRDEDIPSRVLTDLRAAPIRLRIHSIAQSAKFTKTLFVRFTPNRALEELVAMVARDRKSLQDPHLSLIYRKLPVAIRRELSATIKLPFREVVFDGIKAVECPSPTENRRDVENWRVVAARRLSGSSVSGAG